MFGSGDIWYVAIRCGRRGMLVIGVLVSVMIRSVLAGGVSYSLFS